MLSCHKWNIACIITPVVQWNADTNFVINNSLPDCLLHTQSVCPHSGRITSIYVCGFVSRPLFVQGQFQHRAYRKLLMRTIGPWKLVQSTSGEEQSSCDLFCRQSEDGRNYRGTIPVLWYIQLHVDTKMCVCVCVSVLHSISPVDTQDY